MESENLDVGFEMLEGLVSARSHAVQATDLLKQFNDELRKAISAYESPMAAAPSDPKERLTESYYSGEIGQLNKSIDKTLFPKLDDLEESMTEAQELIERYRQLQT